MKKILLSFTAVFGSIPGIAVLARGIGVPPDYKILFGGIIEAIGVFTLLLLYINREKIKQLSVKGLNKQAVFFISLFWVTLIIYLALAQVCLISHPTHGDVYYPLWITGNLEKLISRTGGRWEALATYGNYAIVEGIQQQPWISMALTTIILLFVYQAIFTSLTITFGLLSIRQSRAGSTDG